MPFKHTKRKTAEEAVLVVKGSPKFYGRFQRKAKFFQIRSRADVGEDVKVLNYVRTVMCTAKRLKSEGATHLDLKRK